MASELNNIYKKILAAYLYIMHYENYPITEAPNQESRTNKEVCEVLV